MNSRHGSRHAAQHGLQRILGDLVGGRLDVTVGARVDHAGLKQRGFETHFELDEVPERERQHSLRPKGDLLDGMRSI